MIQAMKDFPDNVVAFVCCGHVTKHDYATVLVLRDADRAAPSAVCSL